MIFIQDQIKQSIQILAEEIRISLRLGLGAITEEILDVAKTELYKIHCMAGSDWESAFHNVYIDKKQIMFVSDSYGSINEDDEILSSLNLEINALNAPVICFRRFGNECKVIIETPDYALDNAPYEIAKKPVAGKMIEELGIIPLQQVYRVDHKQSHHLSGWICLDQNERVWKEFKTRKCS